MMKKCGLIFCLAVFLAGLSGCETTKSAAVGCSNITGEAVKATGNCAQGAAKDTLTLWGALQAADDWMRKNLW